jgi:hypothetical protein
LAVSEPALKDCWTDSLDENSFDAFNAATEVLLQELVLNNDNADAQKQVVKRLFSEAIDNLGFPGYMFIAALFLAATGEGAMAAELATDLPITLTPAHGKVALEFMKEDLEILLDEIAYIIAQHHECIGGQYDTPGVSSMVTETKQALLNHIGLKSKDEYAIVLNALVSKENNENPGYLQYLINAMKYHLENNPEKRLTAMMPDLLNEYRSKTTETERNDLSNWVSSLVSGLSDLKNKGAMLNALEGVNMIQTLNRVNGVNNLMK